MPDVVAASLGRETAVRSEPANRLVGSPSPPSNQAASVQKILTSDEQRQPKSHRCTEPMVATRPGCNPAQSDVRRNSPDRTSPEIAIIPDSGKDRLRIVFKTVEDLRRDLARESGDIGEPAAAVRERISPIPVQAVRQRIKEGLSCRPAEEAAVANGETVRGSTSQVVVQERVNASNGPEHRMNSSHIRPPSNRTDSQSVGIGQDYPYSSCSLISPDVNSNLINLPQIGGINQAEMSTPAPADDDSAPCLLMEGGHHHHLGAEKDRCAANLRVDLEPETGADSAPAGRVGDNGDNHQDFHPYLALDAADAVNKADVAPQHRIESVSCKRKSDSATSGPESNYSSATSRQESNYSIAPSGPERNYNGAPSGPESNYSSTSSGQERNYSSPPIGPESNYSSAPSGSESNYSSVPRGPESNFSTAPCMTGSNSEKSALVVADRKHNSSHCGSDSKYRITPDRPESMSLSSTPDEVGVVGVEPNSLSPHSQATEESGQPVANRSGCKRREDEGVGDDNGVHYGNWPPTLLSSTPGSGQREDESTAQLAVRAGTADGVAMSKVPGIHPEGGGGAATNALIGSESDPTMSSKDDASGADDDDEGPDHSRGEVEMMEDDEEDEDTAENSSSKSGQYTLEDPLLRTEDEVGGRGSWSGTEEEEGQSSPRADNELTSPDEDVGRRAGSRQEDSS